MIQIRLVADDTDQLARAARLLGQVLAVTTESHPRPRCSGGGLLSTWWDADADALRVLKQLTDDQTREER